MVLWILFAVMTACACVFLLQPFRSSDSSTEGSLTTTDIYKDQLDELDKELEQGLILPEEFDAAKAEISRRILDTAGHSQKTTSMKENLSLHKKTVLGMLVTVPAVALILYLWVGKPNLVPITQAQIQAQIKEQQKKQPNIDELIQKVESHLKKNPDDIDGWVVLARVYANMGRSDDLKRATENINRIKEKTNNIQQLPPEDQQEMIKNMVASLHAKLKENGGDVEAWERLIKSYMVLRQKDAARASYQEARQALSGNQEALDRLLTFVKKFDFD